MVTKQYLETVQSLTTLFLCPPFSLKDKHTFILLNFLCLLGGVKKLYTQATFQKQVKQTKNIQFILDKARKAGIKTYAYLEVLAKFLYSSFQALSGGQVPHHLRVLSRLYTPFMAGVHGLEQIVGPTGIGHEDGSDVLQAQFFLVEQRNIWVLDGLLSQLFLIELPEARAGLEKDCIKVLSTLSVHYNQIHITTPTKSIKLSGKSGRDCDGEERSWLFQLDHMRERVADVKKSAWGHVLNRYFIFWSSDLST